MPPDTVTARVGEEVTIRLPAAPAAGYGWEIDPPPAAVTLVRSGADAAPGTQPPGGPAEQVFVFRASARGKHVLTFRYKRPWESAVLRSTAITLLVE